MTLQERVSKLVRYCGQYKGHGYMMDERNQDSDFNIELTEEKSILMRIDDLRVILMTGEAGDGKSRILRNINSILKEHGFTNPCSDFSALTKEEKTELICQLKEVLAGRDTSKLVISANVGVFTQAILEQDIKIMEELTRERGDVFICNFEDRNLADRKEDFGNIVRKFIYYDEDCEKQDCPCYKTCVYRDNIQKLLSESGMEAIRTICNAIYLTGGHVTFRELLSLLAYTVTFGQDCEDRIDYLNGEGTVEKKSYYHIFDEDDDILLSKVSRMDPARKRVSYPESIHTKEEYQAYVRKLFFDQGQNSYGMLAMDYLTEFYEVLYYMNQPPYHYDTIEDRKSILQRLKRGISKMSSRGKSDTGLVVTDTPAIFDNKIRTEFLVMQDMSLIWHRYDLKIKSKISPPKRLWNKFYLSYLTGESEKKLISLLIDYRQFRFLLMCEEDYFMNRNESTIEEYAVNTFYRKILQENNQAYDSIVIRFDEKSNELCDFSLTVHNQQNIFTGESKRSIRIRKED